MLVLDLFAGTGSSTAGFKEQGDRVLEVELDPKHGCEWQANVLELTPEAVIAKLGGRPDFIWASPPCQAFSVAAIGRYWERGGADPLPKHPKAYEAQNLVHATLALIHALAPRYWLMENPRGMLRKLALVAPYRRVTVTYCQYGDERQKPTDLWGVMPCDWEPKPPCEPGSPCHAAAPRGSRTGTQGRSGSVDRSRVPLALSREIADAVQGNAPPIGGRADFLLPGIL